MQKLSLSGSFTSGSTELTGENVQYRECSALAGILSATVDFPQGCHFQLTSNISVKPVIEEMHLKCGTGESITVTVFESGDIERKSPPVCTFHIFAPQKFPVTYDNVTLANGKMGVEVTFSEIAVAWSHEGSLCGSGEETMHYTGAFQVVGSSGGSPIGITVT